MTTRANSKNFFIRPACEQDCEQIARLANELARMSGEAGNAMTGKKVTEDLLPPDSGFEILVAESRHQVVAYALFHMSYETAQGMKGSYLSDLYVSPEFRRHGIATALIKRIAGRTWERNGHFFWWLEKNDASAAKSLYKGIANYIQPLTAYAAAHDAFRKLV